MVASEVASIWLHVASGNQTVHTVYSSSGMYLSVGSWSSPFLQVLSSVY